MGRAIDGVGGGGGEEGRGGKEVKMKGADRETRRPSLQDAEHGGTSFIRRPISLIPRHSFSGYFSRTRHFRYPIIYPGLFFLAPPKSGRLPGRRPVSWSDTPANNCLRPNRTLPPSGLMVPHSLGLRAATFDPTIA